jgi:CRP-like cAMP-binding protein
MIDLEKLRAFYKFGRNLTINDAQSLLQAASTRSYAVGDYLIKEGSHKKEVFFIQKGIIRSFRINEKGNEITTLLRWENQIIASPDVILFDQPSQNYVEALEETKVRVLDYDVLQDIVSANPKLDANRKYVLQQMLKEALGRIDTFVLMSPEDRYLAYVDQNPEIVNRVPDKYIANVLGITPFSLSRIRKRVAKK